MGKRLKKTNWPVWLCHVTEFMYVCTMIMCLLVIVNTCALAWYSTIVLHQPYPLESLSSQLVVTIIGAIVAKVLGNIFEHNNGGIFGQSDNQEGSTYTDE